MWQNKTDQSLFYFYFQTINTVTVTMVTTTARTTTTASAPVEKVAKASQQVRWHHITVMDLCGSFWRTSRGAEVFVTALLQRGSAASSPSPSSACSPCWASSSSRSWTEFSSTSSSASWWRWPSARWAATPSFISSPTWVDWTTRCLQLEVLVCRKFTSDVLLPPQVVCPLKSNLNLAPIKNANNSSASVRRFSVQGLKICSF